MRRIDESANQSPQRTPRTLKPELRLGRAHTHMPDRAYVDFFANFALFAVR